MRKIHIVGNWKMNQNLEDINAFLSETENVGSFTTVEKWVAPQAHHISKLLENKNDIKVGAQNCCEKNSGAFTGELSPSSLKDTGAHFVIIGHSERRAIYKENDNLLASKASTAIANGLKVIFCVGESLEEHEAGSANAVVAHQLKEGLKDLSKEDKENVIIAYEPVWAIGTGKVATPEYAEDIHKEIRKVLAELDFNSQQTPILYGGSVKPENIKGLLAMENIDGGLIGGASLKGDSFQAMCQKAAGKD